MKEIYLVRVFDIRNWIENPFICFVTEPEAIEYCKDHTNFEAGIVCSYMKVPVGDYTYRLIEK